MCNTVLLPAPQCIPGTYSSGSTEKLYPLSTPTNPLSPALVTTILSAFGSLSMLDPTSKSNRVAFLLLPQAHLTSMMYLSKFIWVTAGSRVSLKLNDIPLEYMPFWSGSYRRAEDGHWPIMKDKCRTWCLNLTVHRSSVANNTSYLGIFQVFFPASFIVQCMFEHY